MTSETAVRSNTEIVREYTQRVFNEHNPDLSSEYFTPEVKWHGGLLGTIEGVGNVTEMLRGFLGALPDLYAAERDIVAAGDTVAVRYVVEATHEGDLLGIAPTGRRVRWDAVDIYRLADGMIVEEWAAGFSGAGLSIIAIAFQPMRDRPAPSSPSRSATAASLLPLLPIVHGVPPSAEVVKPTDAKR